MTNYLRQKVQMSKLNDFSNILESKESIEKETIPPKLQKLDRSLVTMYKQELFSSQDDKLSKKFDSMYPLLYITAMVDRGGATIKRATSVNKSRRYSDVELDPTPFIVSDITITSAKPKRVK